MYTVLQVNNYAHVRGGSDRYFIELVRGLSERGHRVPVLTTADSRNVLDTPWAVPGFVLDAIRPRDVCRFFYSGKSRETLRRLLDRELPDLAHLHIYYGQITPSILGPLRDRGIPIVQTLHEYKLFCPASTMTRDGKICDLCCGGSFWNAVVHRCNRGSLARSLVTSAEACSSRLLGAARKIDHFLAVSDYVRRTMIRFGIPEDRISTVHNYIDVGSFEPEYEPGGYFLYLGRIEKNKGILTLLDSLEHTHARLVVAGEGELRSTVQREIERRGLAAETVGFKSGKDLHDLVRGCRCVIVPSECAETFGLVILEAYALGKPVIASRMGGIPEVVREGETGLLFEAGNVSELAHAMEWMWDHPGQAADMGRAGRSLASSTFGMEQHYEKLMSVYGKVVRR